MQEIGYNCLGRKSIFFIGTVLVLNSAGLELIYFIVFGKISASLVKDIFSAETSFFTEKYLYILIIGALNVPLVIKREIKELKIASVLLFVSIILFILILIYQVIFKRSEINTDEDYNPYLHVKSSNQFLTAVSVFMVAYGFHVNFWSTYVCLENKNNKTITKSVYGSVFLSMTVYFVVSVASVYLFGSSITANVLDNVGKQGATWEALIL